MSGIFRRRKDHSLNKGKNLGSNSNNNSTTKQSSKSSNIFDRMPALQTIKASYKDYIKTQIEKELNDLQDLRGKYLKQIGVELDRPTQNRLEEALRETETKIFELKVKYKNIDFEAYKENLQKEQEALQTLIDVTEERKGLIQHLLKFSGREVLSSKRIGNDLLHIDRNLEILKNLQNELNETTLESQSSQDIIFSAGKYIFDFIVNQLGQTQVANSFQKRFLVQKQYRDNVARFIAYSEAYRGELDVTKRPEIERRLRKTILELEIQRSKYSLKTLDDNLRRRLEEVRENLEQDKANDQVRLQVMEEPLEQGKLLLKIEESRKLIEILEPELVRLGGIKTYNN